MNIRFSLPDSVFFVLQPSNTLRTGRPAPRYRDRPRAQLFAKSREVGMEFRSLLIRFAYEEFLRLLAHSRYRNELLVNGDLLLALRLGNISRPIRTLEFAAPKLWDVTKISKVFHAICTESKDIQFSIDAIGPSTRNASPSSTTYEVFGTATVDKLCAPFHVYIEHAYRRTRLTSQAAVSPLLGGDAIVVQAASLEALVAGKLALICNGPPSHRHFDEIRDLWVVSTNYAFNFTNLVSAYNMVGYKPWETPATLLPFELTDISAAQCADRWRTFVKREKALTLPSDLHEVLVSLRRFAAPILSATLPPESIWQPGQGWVPPTPSTIDPLW